MEQRMAHGHTWAAFTSGNDCMQKFDDSTATLQAFCGLGPMTGWHVQVAPVHLLKGGVDPICQEQASSKSGTALAK